MDRRGICIGGSQHGLRVNTTSSFFFTPGCGADGEDEAYTLCNLINERSERQPFWKLETMSVETAQMIVNRFVPTEDVNDDRNNLQL